MEDTEEVGQDPGYVDDDEALDPIGAPAEGEAEAEVAAPEEPAPAQAPAAPWAGSPLASLADRLPAGLKGRVMAGQMTVEDAISRAYGGVHERNTVVARQNRELQKQVAASTQRLDLMMKRLGDTLGIPLEPERPEVTPEQAMSQQLAEARQQMEEIRLDGDVDRCEAYCSQAEAMARQEFPEWEEASAWYGQMVLNSHKQGIINQLRSFQISRDPNLLAGLDTELLERGMAGEMSFEEIVEISAATRALATYAQIKANAWRTSGNHAAMILQSAIQAGWRPSGQQQAQPQVPQQPQRQPPPVPPAPASVDRLRRQAQAVSRPAPATAAVFDAGTTLDRISAMSLDELANMLEESPTPQATFERIMALTAST